MDSTESRLMTSGHRVTGGQSCVYCNSTDNGQYQYWKMQATLSKLVGMKQEAKEPTMSFAERFLTQVEATESLWGPLCPTIAKTEYTAFEDVVGEDDATRMQRLEQWVKDLQEKLGVQDQKHGKARERLLVCLFLGDTDRERYKEVTVKLREMVTGND
jgi:hypothetical protein